MPRQTTEKISDQRRTEARRQMLCLSKQVDEEFRLPRLAALYDLLGADRSALDQYIAMIEEFGARRVLDIGCGTGTLALLLARRGLEVTGIDPAAASLDVARAKPDSDQVHWIEGTAATLPPIKCDAVTMTANVVQFIHDPDQWQASLRGIRTSVAPAGHLVFENRDPAARGWDHWTRSETLQRVTLPDGESVERWWEVTDVTWPLIQLSATFEFESGPALTSTSTLRFRERDEVEADLLNAGLRLTEIRDTANHPGRKFIFVARPAT